MLARAGLVFLVCLVGCRGGGSPHDGGTAGGGGTGLGGAGGVAGKAVGGGAGGGGVGIGGNAGFNAGGSDAGVAGGSVAGSAGGPVGGSAGGAGGGFVGGSAGGLDASAAGSNGAVGGSHAGEVDGGYPLACGGPLGWGGALFAVFSPDATLVAIATAASHVEVRRWPDLTLVSGLSDGIYGVTAVAFSGDGTRFGAADATGVKIWNIANGSLVAQVPSMANAWLLALSATGDTVAAVGSSFQAWRAAAPTQIANWNNAGVPSSLAISPDGSRVAAMLTTNHTDIHAAMWSTVDGAVVWDQHYGFSGTRAGRVVFSPDGSQVALAYGAVAVVKAADGTTTHAIFSSMAYDPWAFSADGAVLAGTGSGGSAAALFRLSDDSVVRSYAIPDKGKVLAVGISSSNAVRSIDVTSSSFGFAENGSMAATLPAVLDSQLDFVAMSRDGRLVATAQQPTMGAQVRVWDAATGVQLKSFGGTGPVAFAPDASFIVHSDGYSRLVADALIAGGRTYSVNLGSTSKAVAFSPGGDLIATGNSDNTAQLLRSNDGSVAASLWTVADGHSQPVTAITFAHDGRKVATGSQDRTVKLWNSGDGSFIRTLTGSKAGIAGVAFTSDDMRLVSAGYEISGITDQRLWNVAGGTSISMNDAYGTMDVKLSPDDLTIYLPGTGAVQRLRMADWSALPSLLGHKGYVTQLAIAADGRRLASVASDGTGRVYCLP